ncbi:MarR family winged helix-turn-helix transcriptional regulator [Cellulomonas marina]|uniref:DNA-binding transcriptional regulator, MarR family n=1 Tax=Cellulomonas marina TaxID=988821 RepID=A0A1I0ZEW0_9CELL|nr:MarR family transcriptional regulator [Cellulomonas marina]GIG28523.1 MarR family transcriptional regulator [Cellulomonas marina]SFB24329.1 DNA-binding transcriptional regulator, MarR family [Cellulomonas marina]
MTTGGGHAVTTGSVADPLALEAQVCLAMSAAARDLVAFYRPLLAPLGLTHPQYLVMLALWQHGELTLTRLAALLHLEPGTASPLVRRLEAQGLVERTRSADDGRALVLRATAAGRALREQALAVPGRMLAGLALTVEEAARIREAAELLVGACARARTDLS